MSSPSSADRRAAARAAAARRRGPRLDRLDRTPGARRPRGPAGRSSESSRSPPADRATLAEQAAASDRQRRPGDADGRGRRRGPARRRRRRRARRAGGARDPRRRRPRRRRRRAAIVSLVPVLAALAAGKVVATANKETLVAGGHLVMPLARARAADVAADGPRATRSPARSPGSARSTPSIPRSGSAWSASGWPASPRSS